MDKKEQIEKSAKEYIKTLQAINYRTLYHFGTQNIEAFTKGAEWALSQPKEVEPKKEVDLEELRKQFTKFLKFETNVDMINHLTLFDWFLPHLQKPVESDAVNYEVKEEVENEDDDKIVTDYCHDHTPYRGVCSTCGRY